MNETILCTTQFIAQEAQKAVVPQLALQWGVFVLLILTLPQFFVSQASAHKKMFLIGVALTIITGIFVGSQIFFSDWYNSIFHFYS